MAERSNSDDIVDDDDDFKVVAVANKQVLNCTLLSKSVRNHEHSD